MFAARRHVARQLTQLSRRHFGADAHHSTHNPPRMEFEEWKQLSAKLKQDILPAAEKNNIHARFTEARLAEHEVKAFEGRLSIERMTDAEFETRCNDLVNSTWAKHHPQTAQYNLACLKANRAGQKAPDMFDVEIPTAADLAPYSPQELGKGNELQKLLNEYMYEVQNCPNRSNKLLGGLGIDMANSKTIQSQSIIYFWTCMFAAVYGANLYRDMYIEKYSLWDMLNWETRVICARAEKERGW